MITVNDRLNAQGSTESAQVQISAKSIQAPT